MKKCPDCTREIDKHGIACQYCGRLLNIEEADHPKPGSKDLYVKNDSQSNGVKE